VGTDAEGVGSGDSKDEIGLPIAAGNAATGSASASSVGAAASAAVSLLTGLDTSIPFSSKMTRGS
jgi:hypothetical protein